MASSGIGETQPQPKPVVEMVREVVEMLREVGSLNPQRSPVTK
jgi:hypothetical protein